MVTRKRMRLEDYDYSQAGAYFITICTMDSVPLFGNIIDSEMKLNVIGGLVNQVLQEVPEYYTGVILDANQIMPDHLHAIFGLVGSFEKGVVVKPATGLPKLIQKFKSLTSRRYGDFRRENQGIRLPEQLWQRGYYDRVIRSDSDLEEKRDYILTNPLRWQLKHKSG